MNHPPFKAPSLEAMSALLPAFDFTNLIASDEFGAVYMAQQRSLERNVAIKILAPGFSENPEFQTRFESTARSMAKLNHPNLISVFDSGCVDGMLYVVMEFVPGKSLEHSTCGQSVDSRQAMLLIEGICEGISHAHSHQIIHGGLSPSNILLNQKAEPKIGNFGFSHPGDSGMASKASSRFIAPEILANSRAADPRADIYSVGAILYELITGQLHGPDAAPPSGFAQCNPKLDDIWRQATQADPDLRFPDMRSLMAALKQVPVAARTPVKSAPPASGGPVSPPSPPQRPPRTQVGFNWKLVRNLFIIAGLLYAISFAWKNLENTRNQRDKENREALAQIQADKEKAIAEARARALEHSQQAKPVNPKGDSGSSSPAVPEVSETPAESLERLRKNLASGSRAEMPIGTIQKGENDYFFVTEPKSWPDAAWFAEQHGGHLAIPNATADLTWLVGEVSASEGTWIGAARSGRNSWALADGSVWKPAKEPTGIGQYLAADKHGFLHAENASTLHPFIIQWHRDGSNPGTLTAQLSATKNSLTQPNPVFPPGTRTYGVRHYLFVSRPVAWREAVDLAETAGGHLAVPSQIAEIINLEEMTSDLAPEYSIWMGGFLKGDHWLWITGEPWKTAKWIEGADTTAPDSALIVRPGKGWDAQNLSDTGTGFIIEWSNDRKSADAPEIEAPARGGDTTALVNLARKLITDADAKRTNNLVENIRKFTWDLDNYIRPLPKGSQAIWSPHVERLKSSIKDNRLPSSVPKESGIELSAEMAKLAQFHSQKQDRFDLEFMADAEKLRVAFIGKLNEAQAQAKASGQPKLVESIRDILSDASNLENWVRQFGVELQPENPVVTNPTRRKMRRNQAFPGDGIPEPGKGGLQVE